jgi:phage gpG-like protein
MIDIKFEFPDLKRKVQVARREIELVIAATLQTNRGMLFDNEGAYNGHQRWAPLVFRSGQILSKRGTLRKSIAPSGAVGVAGPGGIVEIMPDIISVGTSLAYAAMMNFGTTRLPGGVLKPVRAKALKIPVPLSVSKEGFIFRKSVKIPERRFDILNDIDKAEIEETLNAKIAEVLNR